MRIAPVTPPSIEPVTIAEALIHLRLEGDAATADTPYVTSLISAARLLCERRAHLAFVTQTYDLWLDQWDGRPWSNLSGYVGWSSQAGTTLYNNAYLSNQVVFPVGPVQSVSEVNYIGIGLDQQTWDASNYIVSPGLPGKLAPVQNVPFPPVASQIDVVQIRVIAGYGDLASAVPELAKSAIKLAVSWLYEKRSPSTSELAAVDYLLGSLGCGTNLFA